PCRSRRGWRPSRRPSSPAARRPRRGRPSGVLLHGVGRAVAVEELQAGRDEGGHDEGDAEEHPRRAEALADEGVGHEAEPAKAQGDGGEVAGGHGHQAPSVQTSPSSESALTISSLVRARPWNCALPVMKETPWP